MQKIELVVGDVNSRLSLAHALSEGYVIEMATDGDARIVSPEGREYIVAAFECDCPDARCRNGGSNHGHCKHAFWAAQAHPCECGNLMLLGKFVPCVGPVELRFGCECGAAESFETVAEERAQQEAKRFPFHQAAPITRLTPIGDYVPEGVRMKDRKADWRRIVDWECRSCGWGGRQMAGANSCPDCQRMLTRPSRFNGRAA